jgi:hypothetical protein
LLDCLKTLLRHGSDQNAHSMEPCDFSSHPRRHPTPNKHINPSESDAGGSLIPKAPRNRRGRRLHVKLLLNMFIKPRETTVSILIKPSFHPVTNECRGQTLTPVRGPSRTHQIFFDLIYMKRIFKLISLQIVTVSPRFHVK